MLTTKPVLCALLLLAFARAQDAAKPAAATSVASSISAVDGSNNIKPEAIAPSDSTSNANIVADPASLLADPAPIPSVKATLVGGTIDKVDRLRDKITVNIFGGGRMSISFDPRTQVLVGQTNGTTSDLREGARIYLDTILDGTTIFAKSIRLEKTAAIGEGQGIVIEYRADRNELTIRDAISPTPLHLLLLATTRFTQADRTVPSNTLMPGTLVGVRFDRDGNRDVAREVSILALPGTAYTFAGQVTYLDLRTGLLVLNSSTDHKTYEVYLDPSVAPDENLRPGSVVTVVANYKDARYVARNISVDSSAR